VRSHDPAGEHFPPLANGVASRLAVRMNVLQRYQAFIDWTNVSTGLPDSVLHIHAGLAVLVAARVVTGRSLGSFVPFAAVVLVEGANETMDRLIWGSWRWPETRADLAYTLAWPLLLSVVALVRPARRWRRAAPGARSDVMPDNGSGTSVRSDSDLR